MKKLLNCRRSQIALVGIASCLLISLVLRVDTSVSILGIVTSVAGANAAQGIFRKGNQDEMAK